MRKVGILLAVADMAGPGLLLAGDVSPGDALGRGGGGGGGSGEGILTSVEDPGNAGKVYGDDSLYFGGKA